jgi:molecular chaperone DnaK (HSP70)
MNSTPALVEKLHFDKNLPENHNVYISNLRDDYVLMYDGKIWRLKDRDDALQQLYEDKSDILETKFEELIEKLDDQTIRMFNRFLKIKDTDDEKIKIIKKELKKTLYENREIKIKTRKSQSDLRLAEISQ